MAFPIPHRFDSIFASLARARARAKIAVDKSSLMTTVDCPSIVDRAANESTDFPRLTPDKCEKDGEREPRCVDFTARMMTL